MARLVTSAFAPLLTLAATGLVLASCSQPTAGQSNAEQSAAERTERAQTQADPAVTITLTPVAAGPGSFEMVRVALRLEGVNVAAGEALLGLPLVTGNVDTVATVLTQLSARDEEGVLSLEARDAAPAMEDGYGDDAQAREWVTNRATRGTIEVEYSVPADATLPPRGPAPPYSFLQDGGGVSAAGHVFILMPPGETGYRTTIDWDLSQATPDSRAVSSLGEGRVEAGDAMTANTIRSGFYMAGDIDTWPEDVPSGGFFGAVQGTPPFDAAELLSWSGALYADYAVFFGQEDIPPYGVFLRHNPVNAGGGVGLHRSFVTTFDQDSTPQGLKSTLAHEMFHTFQPRLDEPGGLASSWFTEGLAVFYQSRLPLRFGQIEPEDFLEDLNFHAARYYTSAMAEAPNSEIPARFWADTRIRTLPYDRGMLYFVTVDHAVRTASDGARSLDDLMLEMLRRQRAGETLTPADWEEVLRAELGEVTVGEFRAFIDGAKPVPASDAFGPCFTRTTDTLRRYELGFDPAVLAEPVRIVRGLDPESNAARAGVRDGDEIVRPVPQDSIQGQQDAELTLLIRRDGEEFPVTYLPRGDTVDAYQWDRVEGVPASVCGL